MASFVQTKQVVFYTIPVEHQLEGVIQLLAILDHRIIYPNIHGTQVQH